MNTASERLKSDLNLYKDTIGHIENIMLTSFEKEIRPPLETNNMILS